jgi:hypothetical protein
VPGARVLEVLDGLPEAITQPPGEVWSVFACSLGSREQMAPLGRPGAGVNGGRPSPVTLCTPTGTPPDRDRWLTEAQALAKRVAMRALADGKKVIRDLSMAAQHRRARVTAVGVSHQRRYRQADTTTQATPHVVGAATDMGLPRFDG